MVKFTYPPSDTHYEEFNGVSGPLPLDYEGYVFPDYKETQVGEVTLRFIPKPITGLNEREAAKVTVLDNLYTLTMEAFIDNELIL